MITCAAALPRCWSCSWPMRVFRSADGVVELSHFDAPHSATPSAHIDRGAKVLVAYADSDNGEDVRDLGLVHAACIAIIERSALVTTVFTVVGKQILHVRDDYRVRVDTTDGTPPSVHQLLDVAEKPNPPTARLLGQVEFGLRLCLCAVYRCQLPNPDPTRLTTIYAGGGSCSTASTRKAGRRRQNPLDAEARSRPLSLRLAGS